MNNPPHDILTVAIDDGTGNVAYAYSTPDNTLKTGIRRSLVQKGDSFSLTGNISRHTWTDTATGEIYTADETDQPIDTCSTSYQTSPANRTLVIDTLANHAGLAGKRLNIGVTLPTRSFYLPGSNQRNMVRFGRKKENLMALMENNSGATTPPIIESVTVYPEAIPAYFYAATDKNGDIRPEFADVRRVIVADIGQYTCDLAMLEIFINDNGYGRSLNISKLRTTEHGIHRMHDSLRVHLDNRDIKQTCNATAMTRTAIEELIKRGFIGSAFAGAESSRIDITGEIKAATAELNQLIREDLHALHQTMHDIDVIILVGGGAHLLKDVANSDDPNTGWGQVVYTPENPEMAIVLGVYQMMKNN
ncbi:MAG: plasmid segregation protein ParM domain-containing protein [Plesiomonas shigelloides]